MLKSSIRWIGMASKQKIKLADLMKKQIVNFINAIVYSLLLSYLISTMLPELISFTMLAQIIILPVWLGVVFFQSSEKISYGTDKNLKSYFTKPDKPLLWLQVL